MADEQPQWRLMAFTRVFNPDDDSQFVDFAVTLKYVKQTGSGETFVKEVHEVGTWTYLDPENTGEPFEAVERADCDDAHKAFRTKMGDA